MKTPQPQAKPASQSTRLLVLAALSEAQSECLEVFDLWVEAGHGSEARDRIRKSFATLTKVINAAISGATP